MLWSPQQILPVENKCPHASLYKLPLILFIEGSSKWLVFKVPLVNLKYFSIFKICNNMHLMGSTGDVRGGLCFLMEVPLGSRVCNKHPGHPHALRSGQLCSP